MPFTNPCAVPQALTTRNYSTELCPSSPGKRERVQARVTRTNVLTLFCVLQFAISGFSCQGKSPRIELPTGGSERNTLSAKSLGVAHWRETISFVWADVATGCALPLSCLLTSPLRGRAKTRRVARADPPRPGF